MFSTLTLLGGLSDTGDSTSSVDIGLFDNTLAGEDPEKQNNSTHKDEYILT
jgi:hypothetical protein